MADKHQLEQCAVLAAHQNNGQSDCYSEPGSDEDDCPVDALAALGGTREIFGHRMYQLYWSAGRKPG